MRRGSAVARVLARRRRCAVCARRRVTICLLRRGIAVTLLRWWRLLVCMRCLRCRSARWRGCSVRSAVAVSRLLRRLARRRSAPTGLLLLLLLLRVRRLSLRRIALLRIRRV